VPLQVFKIRVGLIAPHLQTRHPHEMTVAEVVQSGRHASIGMNDSPTAADRAAASRALEFFGLAQFAGRTLVELSYGQMRKVLFARAWVRKPQLLLLDEPFAGVDGPTRQELQRHVEAMLHAGAAVVIATHHRSEWPSSTTHELELAGGRAVYCGPLRTAFSGRPRLHGREDPLRARPRTAGQEARQGRLLATTRKKDAPQAHEKLRPPGPKKGST